MERFDVRATPEAENDRSRARRFGNRWAALPALAAAALTLLVVLTPVSQAASVFHPATSVPPYKGRGLTQVTLATLGCGVKATVPVHPKFTTSTGVAIESTKAKAVSCPSPLGYNWARAQASSAYFSKTFTGVSGPHQVVVHWTVKWTSVISASLGPKFNGAAFASSFIVGTLYLLDETNLTYLLPSNGWGWFSSTGNGTVSISSSANVTMYLNKTLVSGHVYSITPAMNIASYAYASSSGPSSASASLSLSGTGTKLTSVTFT